MKVKFGAIATAVYFGLLAVGAATPFAYTVHDLGPVSGLALNDLGQVTGAGYHPTVQDPFGSPFLTGPNGVGIHILGPFPTSDNGVGPLGINNSGQVAGVFFNHRGVPRPFVTGPNGLAPHDLGFSGVGWDVNNRGQVVGFTVPQVRGHKSRPFLFSGGATKLLGPFPEGADVSAFTLNDLGQVAGNFNGGNGGRGFLSGPDGGSIKYLESPGPITVEDVNDLGQVVGSVSSIPNTLHAFLSAPDGEALMDLGVLYPNTSTTARAINNAGLVVGSEDGLYHGVRFHAFVYTGVNGLQDLDTLIDPALGIHFDRAIDVNEPGQILATGFFNDSEHTFVLTPTSVGDDASTVTLLAVSVVCLALIGFGSSLRRQTRLTL